MACDLCFTQNEDTHLQCAQSAHNTFHVLKERHKLWLSIVFLVHSIVFVATGSVHLVYIKYCILVISDNSLAARVAHFCILAEDIK